jgi:DNA-binding PucR family transcriptional regulator
LLRVSYSDPSIALIDALPAARTVGLADPLQPAAGLVEGELVLGIGLDDQAAAQLLRAARTAKVAGVVLADPAPVLTELAGELNIELHRLPPSLSWRQLHQQLTDRLRAQPVRGDDELAELAQTIATLTGGLVTIEDTSARILAYSRSSDEVDELRRLSILGRSGPPAYLALLREWGVYDRLAASEEVVEIAEHPASGVRRRLAVGVFAGRRQLGTIWLQQGSTEFSPHARQALLGAARLTAEQLTGRSRLREDDGLATLLAGHDSGVLARMGRDAGKPCAVAVFAPSAGTDPAADRIVLEELSAIVTVHGAALRRRSLTGVLDRRVYLLLPNLASSEIAHPMIENALAAVRQHLDPQVRAGIGACVESVAAAPRSRHTADLALGVDQVTGLLDFAAVRARLITALAENSVAQQAELLDVRFTELIGADPDSARTLLGYLDTGSDVRRVADELDVHQTTVRYRLRRAAASLGLDLADPEDRLSAQLQLRCGLRSRDKAR